MSQWLLLVYKVPREPTAGRVYVWRKLKQLGALLLHDSVWILPNNARTEEQFQWLAAEIVELQGEATLWHADVALDGREALVARFTAQAEEVYQEILDALRRKDRDLAALGRRFQQAQAIDYFSSPLAAKVRDALMTASRHDDQPEV